MKAIPGIGDYTAGAIGSIAYKIPTPVVDGNVVRVFSRLKSIAGNPKNSKLIKLVWDIAKIAVDGKRPGDFNQSLMELGATICAPKSPNCYQCPISVYCSALKEKQSYDDMLKNENQAKVALSSSTALQMPQKDKMQQGVAKVLPRSIL